MLPLKSWEATALTVESQGKLLRNQRVNEKRVENGTETENLPLTRSYEIAKPEATNRNQVLRNIKDKTRTWNK
jgi:hypothetical protein